MMMLFLAPLIVLLALQINVLLATDSPIVSPSVLPSVSPSESSTSAPVQPTSAPVLQNIAPTLAPTLAPVPVPIPATVPMTTAPTSTDLPPIKCESFSIEPQPQQVACPNAKEMVATAVGHVLNQLVYANGWLQSNQTSIYPDTIKNNETVLPLLGLCGYDCDVDSDCAPGLLCADAHKPELKARNLNVFKARCDRRTTGYWHDEVCFPKELLTSIRPWPRSLVRRNGNADADATESNHDDHDHDKNDHDDSKSAMMMDQHHHQNQPRDLACSWKCLSICVGSSAPACLVLRCSQNCRRRLGGGSNSGISSSSISSTTSTREIAILEYESQSMQQQQQRRTQIFSTIDIATLLTLATTKLRQLASDPTITNVDSESCKHFLQTAICSVDTSSP